MPQSFREVAKPAFWPANCLFPIVNIRGTWTLAILPILSAQLPARAAGPVPEGVLDRYLGAGANTAAWNAAEVDIDASLPKLAESGRLRAIRRILFGRIEYQILEVLGDRTVKQQVIARYLSAEREAAGRPASQAAITEANYRFHFRGASKWNDAEAYLFEITPRKKRVGLIRGELWIDPATGALLRESGRMVRSPSIFIRRIDVIRDMSFSDGQPLARVTHLSIDTRLVGRAELTVTKRPLPDNPGPVSTH
jgi:hypothetical protein